jgi:hypothetical protein
MEPGQDRACIEPCSAAAPRENGSPVMDAGWSESTRTSGRLGAI